MPESRRSALPVIFSLVILSPLAIDVYLPSLPEMARLFSASDSAMQMTISLFMICMGVGQLFAGPLSDKYGRRFSALLGIGLYVMGSILGSIASDLTVMYCARVLQGFGAAGCAVTAFAWVRDNFNAHDSGKWISYMGGMIGTIPTLAPMLGGVLAIQWGWEANFIFMAVLSSIIFLAAFKLMNKGRPAPVEHHEEPSSLYQQAKEILTHRQFLIYSLTGMLTMGGILAYATNAPFVAMNMAGMDEFGFAMAFGSLGILQFATSFYAPRLVDRIGRRRTIGVGAFMAVLGAMAILSVSSDSPLWFFPASAIGAVGFNLIFGTASGLTLEHFKHCAGLAAAIDGFARMTGGGLIASALKLSGGNVFECVALAYALMLIPFVLNYLEIMRKKNLLNEVRVDQTGKI
ncbi:multidrug effflux MFS transporter [Endozoicomonas sp. OPT23]|uniref:multidrug effflux MFS transporter n=1 Tax=Endozoicomonas sp. OPT23 TaxID=2072845 RepID=UPI001891E33B|nr:multidrug effflux MFS transporter [Endozoicomonas sp. OPT23]